jgi:hypothetical protein
VKGERNEFGIRLINAIQRSSPADKITADKAVELYR